MRVQDREASKPALEGKLQRPHGVGREDRETEKSREDSSFYLVRKERNERRELHGKVKESFPQCVTADSSS